MSDTDIIFSVALQNVTPFQVQNAELTPDHEIQCRGLHGETLGLGCGELLDLGTAFTTAFFCFFVNPREPCMSFGDKAPPGTVF